MPNLDRGSGLATVRRATQPVADYCHAVGQAGRMSVALSMAEVLPVRVSRVELTSCKLALSTSAVPEGCPVS